jgi:phosphatidylglycerophosphate synthase
MAATGIRKSIPNLLTCSRFIIAPFILIAALQDNWQLGFWLVVIALATDFLDGLAAKAFDAHTKLGEQLDPIADFSFAAAGMAGIIFTGGLPLWVGLLMLVPALYVGYIKFFLATDQKIRIMQPMFSVPYLFAVWTVVTWYYAAQAYGWAWWYVPAALLVLLLAALPKRHRLRTWYAWVLTRASRRS